jgi:hypothetical protein
MGRTGSKTDPGIMAALPATIKTVIVSPITRLIPSIIDVEIPDPAAGIITLTIVCHLFAPNAKDASRKCLGT